MKNISLTPTAVKQYGRVYSQFRGVDFSTDSTQVDMSRSPGAVNMISDTAGFPEKRVGWRYLHKFTENVHGLFYAVFEDGTHGLFAHVGTNLYKWQEPNEKTQEENAPELIIADAMADHRSAAFTHRGKVYLLDGTRYRVLTHDDEGYHIKAVDEDEPYIPTIRINITGNETVQIGGEKSTKFYGGHTYEEYEEPNILTYKRKCTMCGDGQSTKFYIGETDIDEVVTVTVSGTEVPAYAEGETQTQWYKVDLVTSLVTFKNAPAMHEDGAGLTNIEITYSKRPTTRDEHKDSGTGTKKNFSFSEDAVKVAEVYVAGDKLKPDDDYTVDIAAHNVTINTAPKSKKEVRIVYCKRDLDKETERINACEICDSYGYYNDNRFFFTGEAGEKYKNCDYMSASDDPTYFPYDGYVRVGSDTSRIMGYLKQFDSQLVIKEDNGQDAQIYLRTAEGGEDGTLFPLKQGIKGVGAVSRECFAVLRDNPLFFSKEGVFSIASGQVRDQQSVQDMSFFVNKKLTEEANKQTACAGVWNNYYVLAVNGNAYVADARQRTGLSDTEYAGYEWYYWTNIPAKFFFSFDGALYFTDGMNICRFNSDYEKTYKYSDASYPMIKLEEMTEQERTDYMTLLSVSTDRARSYRRGIVPGVAIEAVWTTKADTMDTIVSIKNIPKKGTAAIVKPYTRSSVDIGYITNREGQQDAKTGVQMDIFDFSDIDFERITFNALDIPTVIPLNKKIKKFNIIQFIVKSSGINEGFGLYGVQLTYTIGRYVK